MGRTPWLAVTLLAVGTSVGFTQHRILENGQATLEGPDAGLFADTPFRKKIDLAGAWEYMVGGENWSAVSVPGSCDFVGRTVFQRTFNLTGEMLDRHAFSLVAYGINYQSEISVNGIFVGRHLGGYTSFQIPIPPKALQVGDENVITITVENELTPRTTLPSKQRVGGWRTYGGIIRDIYLLATPRIFIGDVEFRSDLSADQKTARLRIRAFIENRGYEADTTARPKDGAWAFHAELCDKLSGALVAETKPAQFAPDRPPRSGVTAEMTLSQPRLWSPASPDLFVVKCYVSRWSGKTETLLDEYDFNVGIRDVKLKEGTFVLNGSPLVLQGVVWREDHPSFGAAMSYEALEKDIAQIKSLGANSIRLLHPPHPYILNLCDRYGLFVMEEIPLVGVPSEILTTEQIQELAGSYLREMIMRDRNHVSVLAWGLGDEFDSDWSAPGVCDVLASLRGLVASLDRRPAYYVGAHNDPCRSKFDIVALNTYTQDAKEFRQLLKEWKEDYPSKPVVAARLGKEVQPGNRNGYSDPLSAESQARYAMQHLDAVKELKLAGSMWWSFTDWRSDRPALSTHSGDPYIQAMGLLSYGREKRLAYDVVRAVFNGEKVAALPIGNYSPGAPLVYSLSGLVVLIALAFIYNNNRRFRDNVNRALTRTYNFFADVRDQRILTYAHSLFLALIISVTWATVLSSVFAHYRDSLFLDNLLSQFMPDFMKEWFVRLVWNPTDFIAVFSCVLLVTFLLLSFLVQLFSLLARSRVYFYHSVSVTVWSMLPSIVLIPVAMILYRIMDTPFYVVPSFAFMGGLVVWALLRLLKGISVIYDVYPVKVYVVGFLFLIGCAALAYGYLDYTQATSVYLKHMVSFEPLRDSAPLSMA